MAYVYKKRGQHSPYKPVVSGTVNRLSGNDNALDEDFLVSEMHLNRITDTSNDRGTKGTKGTKGITKKKSLPRDYTAEEIKSSEWYQTFLRDYPCFDDIIMDHTSVV